MLEPSAGVELTIRDHVHGNAPFVPPGDAFSAAVFMKPEAAVGPENRERLVMSSGNGYYHGFRLCLRPDVRRGTYHPFLEIGTGDGRRAWALDAPPGSVTPGYWHRVAATWDGRVARLYVNGREVAAAPYGGKYVHSPDGRVKTGIPGESYGILSLPFLLDRATVWTRGISASEVAAFAPGDAFEPDTPDFAQIVARIELGDIPSPDAIRRAKKGLHSESLDILLDKGLCLALIAAKDLQVLLSPGCGSFQIGDLPFAGQKGRSRLVGRAPRHGTARVHDVPCECDQPEGVPPGPHDLDAALQVPGDHGTTQ